MFIGGAAPALRVTIPSAGRRLDSSRVAQREVGGHTRFCANPTFFPCPFEHPSDVYKIVDNRPERFPLERLRRVNFDPNLCIA
jgi:hypothetical protein